MHSLSRSASILAALALLAGTLPGCGSPAPGSGGGSPDGSTATTDGGTSGTDAGMEQGDAGSTGTGTDAGMQGSDGGFVAGQIHHQNYVPADLHPTSAARLIVMGDSISAGYRASKDTWAYYNLLVQNDDTQYPNETNTSLTKLFNVSASDLPVVNVAVAGATTADMANKQPMTLTTDLGSTVSGHSIVVITIGGNDFLQNPLVMDQNQIMMEEQNAVMNIQKVVTFLQNKTQFTDGVSIYLADVYDPTDGSGVLDGKCVGYPGIKVTNMALLMGLDQLRQDYINLATQMDFAVVDALGHFHGHGIYASDMTMMYNKYYDPMDPNTWFYSDCIHPNDPGHNELRRVFFEAIDNGHYTATED